MACFSPLKGWYSRTVNPSGKRSVVFDRSLAYVDMPVEVPCGQCIGCRLERSRIWAVRCVHEASLYDENCFITLTFNDVFSKRSLNKADFQKFMKRLRKRFNGCKIRYFHCGEYGELFSRAHHHACLFGFDFPDKEIWSVRGGVRLYRSKALEELWPFGFCTIGDVSWDSAAYVARYVTKKITGDQAASHYGDMVPEYVTMSRRPGIGRDWYEKFKSDVYNVDKVIVRNNIQCRPPRYYDNIFDVDSHKRLAIIKANRKKKAFDNSNNCPDRLAVRERLLKKKYKEKGRSYENGSV